jgi:hypothetical protein
MGSPLLALSCLLFSLAVADIAKDEIISLPGWSGALPSRHFSGYLNFTKTKHMHYWLVESENDPVNDPIGMQPLRVVGGEPVEVIER